MKRLPFLCLALVLLLCGTLACAESVPTFCGIPWCTGLTETMALLAESGNIDPALADNGPEGKIGDRLNQCISDFTAGPYFIQADSASDTEFTESILLPARNISCVVTLSRSDGDLTGASFGGVPISHAILTFMFRDPEMVLVCAKISMADADAPALLATLDDEWGPHGIYDRDLGVFDVAEFDWVIDDVVATFGSSYGCSVTMGTMKAGEIYSKNKK